MVSLLANMGGLIPILFKVMGLLGRYLNYNFLFSKITRAMYFVKNKRTKQKIKNDSMHSSHRGSTMVDSFTYTDNKYIQYFCCCSSKRNRKANEEEIKEKKNKVSIQMQC